jgi:HD-GYP domain-containing protein (c-di-GMP phosphodiesterase class II)
MQNKDQLCDLGFAAILHDIGKVFVKKEILSKESALDDAEFEEMKHHPSLGYDYIKKVSKVSNASKIGILHHHEKFGGGGYPDNLMEEAISLYGRIIAIADVYDAMTSDRPYRKGIIPSEVIEYIMGCSNTLFDPDLVNLFIRKIAPYPIGTTVNLSNGLTGIVVENYESFSMRPKLRIFRNHGIEIPPYEISLSDRAFLNITITGNG